MAIAFDLLARQIVSIKDEKACIFKEFFAQPFIIFSLFVVECVSDLFVIELQSIKIAFIRVAGSYGIDRKITDLKCDTFLQIMELYIPWKIGELQWPVWRSDQRVELFLDRLIVSFKAIDVDLSSFFIKRRKFKKSHDMIDVHMAQ